MKQLGKITFKKLETSDHDKLQVFLNACIDLGYENNKSFESIKLDKMIMPYGQFFIGLDEDKIFTFAGIHIMQPHKYRCLFRGAGLPGYSTGLTGLRASYQFIYLLNMQIDFILAHDSQAEFYLTTNHVQDNGKSSKMNKIWCPRITKQGVLKLVDDSFLYHNTLQSLWKIDVVTYKQWRVI
jgi:hypothetical protein